MMRKHFSFLLILIFLTACQNTPNQINYQSLNNIKSLAKINGYENHVIVTSSFILQSFIKIQNPKKPLHIYIEGDGNAWKSRTQLSTDPTPKNLLVMHLAIADPHPNIVYLARPCQFVSNEHCQPQYWSSHRFSSKVIEATSEAIDYIKNLSITKAQKIELIGFSGGGAVAALLSNYRDDVESLRTIAGNLNTKALSRFHSLTPLYGSENPINIAHNISHIPQNHFFGEDDFIIPSFVSHSFIYALESKENPKCGKAIKATKTSHARGWKEKWPTLLAISFDCSLE